MTPTSLVIGLLAVPVVVLTVLRVNAVMVFLSLCLGQVLVQFVGDDVTTTVGIMAAGTGHANTMVISLALLLLPVILTALFMARTVNGHLKLALNVLPSLSVAVLALLLAEPHFSAGLRGSIEATDVWYLLNKLQTDIIGASAILSLFFLWLQRPKRHVAEEK